MKRRILCAVLALTCVGSLSSCSLLPHAPGSFYDSDEKVAAAQMKRIADAVRDHKVAALRRLFSLRAREKANDLDDGLRYFLSVFPSGAVTWKTQGTRDVGTDAFFQHALELFGNYEVSADGATYDLYFAYFSRNDFRPDEVGIYALGVVPSGGEDDTKPGAKSPFDRWASQFDINQKDNTATGDPGVYVPHS